MDEWWRAGRQDAPDLVLAEYLHAIDMLEQTPEIGHRCPTAQYPELRRVLMKGTRNHLYYEYRRVDDVAEIYAAWGAPRKDGPGL